MKRVLSWFMVLALILSSATTVLGQGADYETSWAKNEINYMKEKQIISGYPDGTFRPENNMTKAEFYKVINGLIGFKEKAKISFEDVKETDWFYGEVQKGVKAKYIEEVKNLKPNTKITREEVARILSIVFGVEEDKEAAKKFTDYNSIPSNLRGVFGGLTKLGYISGYPDGTVRPKGEIKRAEVVKMLHNLSGEIVNVAGTYKKNVKTNMVVNTADVVLKDITIEGNLYLAEGIGEGDVTLDNVVVKGELRVKGGGANSVIIRNSTINQVVIDRQEGLVRVVFENTTVEGVKTYNEVTLELKPGAEVKVAELDGKVQVLVEEGANIATLEVVNNEIVVEAKGNIESIKTTAEIKVNGVTVKANSEVKVADGKAPETVTPAPTQSTTPTPPTTSSGSTGGGGGGGGVGYDPDPTPTVVRVESVSLNKSLVELNIGGTTTLTATVSPANATNKSVTWTSSNTAIAIVDATGKVTAKQAGFTTITVKTADGGKTATCNIGVVPRSPSILPLEDQDDIWKDGKLTAEELDSAQVIEEVGKRIYLDIELPDGIGTGEVTEIDGKEILEGFWVELGFYNGTDKAYYSTVAPIQVNDIEARKIRKSIPVEDLEENLIAGETYTMKASIVFVGDLGGIESEYSGGVKIVYKPETNKTELRDKISEAQGKLDNAKVGTEVGNYPQEAVNELTSVIETARQVDNNVNATQTEINSAVEELRQAITTFEGKVIVPPSTYRVVLTSSVGGKAEVVTEAVYFVAGEQVKVQATPENEYKFVNWTDGEEKEASKENPYEFTMPAKDVNLKANFEKNKYTLTLTGENITSNPEAGLIDENTEVTVTVAPAEGQQVATFTVNGVDKKAELAENKYTFTITADTTVAVTYAAIPAIEATFESTNNIGIAPVTAGDAAGKIYAEYKLVADSTDISLAASNVDYIKVKVGEGEWTDLTANTDATLWFNVEASNGVRSYEVKTKDGKVYTATLEWNKAINTTATWTATGGEGIRPGTKDKYVEYKLMDGEKQVSFKVGEAKLFASKDIEGKWKSHELNTDTTLWLKKDVSGTFTYFIVAQDGTMYMTTLEYTAPVVPMSITANVPEFTVDKPAIFTVGTLANSDEGKMVRAHFTLPEGATIEYQEGGVEPWIQLEDVFGPADGFPLGDITTTFRGTFDKAGTNTVKVEFKLVSDGTVLGSIDITVEVVKQTFEGIFETTVTEAIGSQGTQGQDYEVQGWDTSPNYTYTTDGAFYTLQLMDDEDKLVTFASVFEEFTLQTEGSINIHKYHSGLRNQADFTGKTFEGHNGTAFLSDNGGTLRNTDLNGTLFYGIHSDIYGVNIPKDTNIKIIINGTIKGDATKGSYNLIMKLNKTTRQDKDTKHTFDGLKSVINDGNCVAKNKFTVTVE